MAINSLSTGFRPGVCTSSTRPTAPYEGQMIFETDTDRMYVWNGSAWVIPNQTTQNPTGLELITSATFSGTTNNVPYIFSSTYDNYRVVINNMTIGAAGYFSFRMLNGTTAFGSAQYYSAARGFDSNANARDLNAAGASIGYVQTYFTAAQTNAGSVVMDIVNPFATKVTFFTMQSSNFTYGGYTSHNGSVAVDNLTSYDGLQFLQHLGGTTVGGTVRVYGYRQ